jgi:hypothetical protein
MIQNRPPARVDQVRPKSAGSRYFCFFAGPLALGSAATIACVFAIRSSRSSCACLPAKLASSVPMIRWGSASSR